MATLVPSECTLVVKEHVKVKKEAFRAWLARGYPKAAKKYWEARRSAALVVTKAKSWVWKEFGEAMQKDFWLASKKFRQTVGAQEGKAEVTQVVSKISARRHWLGMRFTLTC